MMKIVLGIVLSLATVSVIALANDNKVSNGITKFAKNQISTKGDATKAFSDKYFDVRW